MAESFLRDHFVFFSAFPLHSCSKQWYSKQALWNAMPQDVLQEELQSVRSLSKLGDSEEVKTCVWVGEREMLWGARWEKRRLFPNWGRRQKLENSQQLRSVYHLVAAIHRTCRNWWFIKENKIIRFRGLQWYPCMKIDTAVTSCQIINVHTSWEIVFLLVTCGLTKKPHTLAFTMHYTHENT